MAKCYLTKQNLAEILFNMFNLIEIQSLDISDN